MRSRDLPCVLLTTKQEGRARRPHRRFRLAPWIDRLSLPVSDHVDPSSWQKINETPLHWAVLNGHEVTVRLLLDHGASVNAALVRATALNSPRLLGRTVLLLSSVSLHTQPPRTDGTDTSSQPHIIGLVRDLLRASDADGQRHATSLRGLSWLRGYCAAAARTGRQPAG